MRVLAVENPAIRVLNYSPGAVLTAMQKEVRETSHDQHMRQWSIGERDESAPNVE